MRNTVYAIVAACLAMLATSGIVALATASPAQPQATTDPTAITFDLEADDPEFEAWVSRVIDEQYREILERERR